MGASLEARWKMAGTNGRPMINLDKVNFSTFAARVVRSSSGCWEWQGTLRNGYGLISENGPAKSKRKQLKAHRYAYEAFRMPIPEGLTIDHLCRNRCCVNPFHLEPVTRGENLRRGPFFGANKTHCPRGHEYNEHNTYIDSKNGRRCRECARIRNQLVYWKKTHP